MCWAIVTAKIVTTTGLRAKNYTDDILEFYSQDLLRCCEKEILHKFVYQNF